MRRVAVIMGGLLFIGGAVLVVVADQQRVEALDEARSALVRAEEQSDATRDANYRLAERLTSLRDQVAVQETELSDDTGFLR